MRFGGTLILLTTSDYLPQLGGLSTFTENMEKSLKELGIAYEVFHWKKHTDIKLAPDLNNYEFILNVHPQFAWLSESSHEKMINFIHGSEVLMTSPNLIKRIFRKMKKREYFAKLEKSHLNIFISESTQKKAINQGYVQDYSRDIILHNCIDTSDSQFHKKEIRNNLVFSCIVRNVAHKNLAGTLSFCEKTAEVTGRVVELIVPDGSNLKSDKIQITELLNNSNLLRDEAYKRSHYNLLLSLDHSSVGFCEGFGLTVLEAAKFGTPSIVLNTGGLPEAVHHGETGWVINVITKEIVSEIFSKENEYRYYKMAVDCFEHTRRSHSLNEYVKLLKLFLKKRSAA